MKNKKRILALVLGVMVVLSSGCQNAQPDTSTAGSETEVWEEASVVIQEPEAETEEIAVSPSIAAEDPYEEWKVLGLSFEGNVDDSSANGNHGTLKQDGTFVEGVNGQALYFDGRNYIDLGSSGSLQPEKLTFVAWIKAEGTLAGEHMITWFKPNGNYKGEGWYLSCLDNNTPLKLSVGKAAGQPMEIFVSGNRSEFFPDGEWVHIGVTYDSTTHKAAIYRNGVSQSVQYINTISEINEDEKSKKYIGFNSPSYNGGFVKMTMDELGIYETVLSATDIVSIYTRYGAEFDGSEVVENDFQNLNVPMSSIKYDIMLPTQGEAGSTITWTSSDEMHLTGEGVVTRPGAGENDANVTLTAEISYGGFAMKKEFNVCVEAMPEFGNLNDFFLGDVQLLDDYEVNAFELEVAYLKSLDADKLLRGFCDIAGVTSSSPLYGGWETSAIQGHTLGHYLTAVSQAYAVTKDAELLEIINHMVDVLAQCQNPETGYLAAIPEDHYVRIEKGNTSGTWVPWYSMHKILAGLVDTYEKAGSEKGLEVASKLGDWVYSRTSNWTPEMQITVLNVEYGGMNDCLYQLYKNTKSEKHLQAAHSFDEMALFDALYDGKDILNGKHANTTIPKIVGALNRYFALGEGEEYYLQVAENFWEIVVSNHTYITGGNSEWEHFGLPRILDAERTNCTCETCNTYNMLKLSRGLFKVTGNRKYADYYENTFINAILSSQNPETGMTTYFQPMATGFFKVYSSPFEHFWCCTGSGMENFSKLGDSIYYKDENSVYVTQFVSSKLTWKEKGLVLTQNSNIPNSDTTIFTVETVSGDSVKADLVLRVPDWCAGEIVVKVNGEAVEVKSVNSFVRLTGAWSNGDVIEYTIPMNVVAYGLPDNENVVAFKYGPVVLSADMGTEDMKTSTTGVNVTVPTRFVEINDVITVTDGSIESWVENVSENVVKTKDELQFTLKDTDRSLVFYPHYLQYKNRYGIYFRMADADTVAEEEKQDKYVVIDSLPVANDQYEFSHNLVADLSSTGTYKGFNYRHAAPDGYFGYDLAVESGVTNYLKVKYCSDDAGRKFTIYVDGEVLENVELSNENPGAFFEEYYEIPAKKTEESKTVSIRFEADQGFYAGGIFDRIAIVKEKEEK